jgi:ABC-type glycerol-3-phosphate transport system permease component
VAILIMASLASARNRDSAVDTGSTRTILAVAAETVLGVAVALLFNREFWGRGLLRTLAILPMVATPTAIALVFVMMYHPTLGVANYLVSLVGLAPFRWTYSSQTAIYALALVDGTLPIAVFNMISYEEINWGTLAAAATLITLPVLLVALLGQRHIVTGLTFGSVKQ